MNTDVYWIAAVLGLIEGVTEFLPISSTGHLIVAGAFFGFTNEKAKVFEIVIQGGAMCAVIWEFRTRFSALFRQASRDSTPLRLALNLLIAFSPAAFVGLLAGSAIKTYLFTPVVVAVALIAGGVAIYWAERRTQTATVHNVEQLTWMQALKVGCAQCLALIPGTSRAAATIIGGLWFGLSRRAATEFSFFLAIPTLTAAGAYDLLKNRDLLASGDVGWFALGGLVAFASALVCIRWLLRFISTRDFTVFAAYRIVFGLLILAAVYTGLLTWPQTDN